MSSQSRSSGRSSGRPASASRLSPSAARSRSVSPVRLAGGRTPVEINSGTISGRDYTTLNSYIKTSLHDIVDADGRAYSSIATDVVDNLNTASKEVLKQLVNNAIFQATQVKSAGAKSMRTLEPYHAEAAALAVFGPQLGEAAILTGRQALARYDNWYNANTHFVEAKTIKNPRYRKDGSPIVPKRRVNNARVPRVKEHTKAGLVFSIARVDGEVRDKLPDGRSVRKLTPGFVRDLVYQQNPANPLEVSKKTLITLTAYVQVFNVDVLFRAREHAVARANDPQKPRISMKDFVPAVAEDLRLRLILDNVVFKQTLPVTRARSPRK